MNNMNMMNNNMNMMNMNNMMKMNMMNMNMMNNNNMNNNNMMMNNNMKNMMMMMQMMNNQGLGNNQMNSTLTRLKKEYVLCSNDNELSLIGCSFGLENENDYYNWKVTILGPKGTPYENGLFTITINFPQDYPNHGAEFKFVNKIYHLNVDFVNEKSKGHICLSSLNEWRSTGKVAGKSCYGVKQALYDIFYLFYDQGTDSPYDTKMCDLYKSNPKKFEEIARQWTQNYAKIG